MPLEFAGAATPLAATDIAEAAAREGLDPAIIAAVAEVESSGGGFLSDRRPKILFEAHVFHRETNGEFGTSNISSPSWNRSLYGESGAHQYERLARAIALDRTAALRSASWGRFQIMGFNHQACGFADVESFVAAMMTTERAHLDAFIAYCRSRRLVQYLRSQDWGRFTLGYNGSGQVDHYSAELTAAFQRHAAGAPTSGKQPDAAGCAIDLALLADIVRALQRVVGVDPDGKMGPKTYEAVLQAQQQ